MFLLHNKKIVSQNGPKQKSRDPGRQGRVHCGTSIVRVSCPVEHRTPQLSDHGRSISHC